MSGPCPATDAMNSDAMKSDAMNSDAKSADPMSTMSARWCTWCDLQHIVAPESRPPTEEVP